MPRFGSNSTTILVARMEPIWDVALDVPTIKLIRAEETTQKCARLLSVKDTGGWCDVVRTIMVVKISPGIAAGSND